ncbi:hypothetical protein RR48_11626 [Papilio machaon]|uniref:Uncharacterized protein n=1 Tax=Papilio machaon TaxID=76193 RepID=A0A194R553_PAPMA|nr:hypothetical protein RR48_11626 [Papilio machaon]
MLAAGNWRLATKLSSAVSCERTPPSVAADDIRTKNECGKIIRELQGFVCDGADSSGGRLGGGR